MKFSAETATAVYEPRPNDAKPERFFARVSVCGVCAHRRAHSCQLADQLCAVLARSPKPVCPALEWPDSPAPVAAIADPVETPAAVLQEARPVAVAVICHNYGRFLRDAVGSILAQTHPAYEVKIVDDASTDETRAIAAAIIAENSGRPITYTRGEWRDVAAARRTAYEETVAPFLVWLDGDDMLAPDYLAEGLKHFSDPATGLVYSDLDQFGDRTGRLSHPQNNIEHQNYAHAGSLIRRAALDTATPDAFPGKFPATAHHDWHAWRAIARAGWSFRKSTALYLYRQHGNSQSDEFRRSRRTYYETGALAFQPLTLFIPLAGRENSVGRLLQFVERQTWPRHLLRIVLADTSQAPEFGDRLAEWARSAPFPDVRIYRQQVATAGAADLDRRTARAQLEVNRAMVRIYSRAFREATTEYVWILEDDITPPDDVAARLMREFEPDVASVAAPYRSRFCNEYHVWNAAGRPYTEAPTADTQAVGGNGFGCAIFRRSVATRHCFTNDAPTAYYDPNFYAWLATQNFRALCVWSAECQHGDPDP